MPNILSAQKAVRQSNTKKQHNLMWKGRIKNSVKTLRKLLLDKTASVDIIKKEESLFYKVVDKAAKNKVIHKNKAKRLKSRISKKVAARANVQKTHTTSTKEPKAKSKSAKPAGTRKKSKSKSS